MGSSLSLESIPDLSGKNIIITGSSSGIGHFTAGVLAAKGAKVFMACRSETKTEAAIKALKAERGDSLDLTFMHLNLASLQSVEDFAQAFLELDLPLHVLINNAGVMACPLTYSSDQLELQFATNHLGHFHLTRRLLPALERAATKEEPARVVCTSSEAHRMLPPKGDGINWDHIKVGSPCENYGPATAYGQSKLCNILFAKSLAERVRDKHVLVNALHPGYVATDLQRNMNDAYGVLGAVGGWIGYSFFAKTIEQGSMSTIYAATSPEVVEQDLTGRYFVPPGKLGKETEQAKNMEVAEKLWQVSDQLVSEVLK